MTITNENKPIKRSPELTPLSRDHHDGLLLCWKIRTGINKSIDLWRIVKYVSWFFETDLKPHFEEEERLVFTLLPAEDENRKKAEAEHRTIYDSLVRVKELEHPLEELKQFADLLDNHIRFEERNLFPYIEQQAAPDALKDAGRLIDQNHKKGAGEWEDEFWQKGVN